MSEDRDVTGRGRWLGLLGVSTLTLLSGCGWFDSGPAPGSAKLRAGADREVKATGALPTGNPNRQYEPGVSAVDETRGQTPQIGSLVKGTGGQKAAREKAEKEAAERDAKAREERTAREAAEKEAKAKEPKPEIQPVTGGLPGRPSAAQMGNPERTGEGAPPAPEPTPAAPSPAASPPATPAPAAPINAAPPPPPPPQPSQSAAPPPPPPEPQPQQAMVQRAVVTTASRDPNKAFVPPPGWQPQGATEPVTATPAVATASVVPAVTTAAMTSAPTPAPMPAPAPAPPPAPIAAPAPVPVQEPAPAPRAVAVAPTRSTDPNKAFVPPPGWTPPGQAEPVVATESVAPAAAPTPPAAANFSVAPAPPPEPTPAPVAPTPARRTDPNKAFVPPAGWAPPASTVVTAAAAPPAAAPAPSPPVETPRARPNDPNRAFVPPPNWTPPGQAIAAATAPPAPPAPPPPPSPAPSVAPAAMAPPPPPAQAQRADPNKAFVPPAGWAPPVAAAPVASVAPAAQMAAAAPPPPAAASQVSTSVAPANRGRQLAIIQFDRGSADLDDNDNAVLTKVAAIVKGNGATIRIVGHAAQDAFGSSQSELANGHYDISRRRALIVADQLIRLGVPRDRIIAEAASDSEPAWETTSERGLTANRRTEIFLDY